MRAIRRSHLEPRVELTPLIDVVFLLLTFFILTMVTVSRLGVQDVELAPVGDAQGVADGPVRAVRVAADGRVWYRDRLMEGRDLDLLIEGLAARVDEPVYLELERSAEGAGFDRGPMLLELQGKLQAAGLRRVTWVGPDIGEAGR